MATNTLPSYEAVPEGSVLIHGARLTGSQKMIPIVRKASRVQVWKGCAAIVFDWSIILGSFAVALTFPNPFTWIAAAVLIAGRQHALLVIMHDATHYRIMANRRWNDRISDWFLAWPLLVTTQGFRSDHLPHHFNLFTDDDPEWFRKRNRPEFQFPHSRAHFLSFVAKDILGFSIFKMMMMLSNFSGASQPNQPKPKGLIARLERPVYYAILISLIVYFQLLIPVLVLWFLPAFTLLFAILRVRNVAEHSNVGVQHDLEMARNILKPTLFERLTVAPHHVGLHLVHHLYPSVPFYNLPQVHRALMQIPEYANESLHVDTYFGIWGSSVLNDLATKRRNEFALLKEEKVAEDACYEAASPMNSETSVEEVMS